MTLSMKIRAHEAELLVVGTEEEQTAEIIRMSPSSADLPSRVAAELPLAGAPTQLHVEPQARTAPAFVSSEDGKYCAGRASVRFYMLHGRVAKQAPGRGAKKTCEQGLRPRP